MEGLVDGYEIQKRVGTLADELLNALHGKEVVICAILKGAVYFAVDISRALFSKGLDHTMYFVEASSYVHQTQQEHVSLTREIVVDKFVDKHVLLVDELYDNGKTLHSVKLLLLEKGIKNITTCVMFRKKKKTEFPQPDYVGFDVEGDWLVGYGLDNEGKSRGAMALCQKK